MNTKETKPTGSLERMVRLINAITEAVREMERCPDDSTQDIWNESLESWRTGLRMNHRLEIEDEPNDKADPLHGRGKTQPDKQDAES